MALVIAGHSRVSDDDIRSLGLVGQSSSLRKQNDPGEADGVAGPEKARQRHGDQPERESLGGRREARLERDDKAEQSAAPQREEAQIFRDPAPLLRARVRRERVRRLFGLSQPGDVRHERGRGRVPRRSVLKVPAHAATSAQKSPFQKCGEGARFQEARCGQRSETKAVELAAATRAARNHSG